jgi:hypothetical protein
MFPAGVLSCLGCSENGAADFRKNLPIRTPTKQLFSSHDHVFKITFGASRGRKSLTNNALRYVLSIYGIAAQVSYSTMFKGSLSAFIRIIQRRAASVSWLIAPVA